MGIFKKKITPTNGVNIEGQLPRSFWLALTNKKALLIIVILGVLAILGLLLVAFGAITPEELREIVNIFKESV